MAWVNLFDHPSVGLQNVQAATSGGSANTIYTAGSPRPPPGTSIAIQAGLLSLQSANADGYLDGCLITGLPSELAGKKFRVTFAECEITQSEYSPFGSDRNSAFSVFSCQLDQGRGAFFSNSPPTLTLSASVDYGSEDGKSTLTTREEQGAFVITGINTGNGEMVKLNNDYVPDGVGVLGAGEALGFWFAVKSGSSEV